MSGKLDLVNQKFGRLTVIEDTGNRQFGKVLWKCICECGNYCVVPSNNLRKGDSKSCGCLQRDSASNLAKKFRKILNKGEATFNRLYLLYKTSAKKRGYVFDIDKENFKRLTQQNCYYCDSIPSQILHRDGCNGDYVYNGIDRLDNNKGYIKGNCVTCCSTCNMAKKTMTEEQFKTWIRKTYLHLFGGLVDKSAGELVDALITIDIKCFMFQEKMLDTTLSEEDRLKYANIVLELNKKRNKSMRAIDFLLGYETNSVTPKTYMEKLDNDEIKPEF